MLILSSTSDLVQVITGSVADVEVHASWIDVSGTTFTPGRTNTASITTATTTTVVASPAVSTQRNVKHLNVYNNHASTSTLITINHTDGTNVEVLWEGTLLASETVVFDAMGRWTLYDSNGLPKTMVFPAATQAQMEGATDNTVSVTPANAQYHPSAVKFWAQVTGAGTPVLSSSYNVTSIADTGVGRMTVTIATDFSSANWCAQVSVFTSATSADEGIPNINAKAAGTIEAGNRIITPAAGDPAVGYDVCGFGDQ